jgi:hypothetical protein
LQFSSLPPEVLYEELQKFDKCIVTWNVVWNKLTKSPCYDRLQVYIKWEGWDYVVNTLKSNKDYCDFDGLNRVYDKNNNYPKVWEYVDFLVINSQNNYWVILSGSIWEWKYTIVGIISDETFNNCASNYEFTWNEVFTNIIEEDIEVIETGQENIYTTFLYNNRTIIFCTILVFILIYIILKNVFRKHKG